MLTRSRYKSCAPLQTISRIKEILSNIGLILEEEWFQNKGGADSCRIRIINSGLSKFDIGTNGKGMNRDFALASAYAEFMERLQNKALFREGLKYATPYLRGIVPADFIETLQTKNILLDFLYFPDEVIHDNIIHAKFENLQSGQLEYFPIGLYRSMCGSTGLCAGNTREEALCQGLNEIIERYVLWGIFYDKIKPLNFLSLHDFQGHEIYDNLHKLSQEFNITIHNWAPQFDGIPVIGLLLSRKSDNTYTYRLGADFNAITALERCYTEIFQGKDVLTHLLKERKTDYQISIDDYYRCRHNGTGVFPEFLIEEDSSIANCHTSIDVFPHHDFNTYNEELGYYLSFLYRLGKDVYVRDNSYLGFPAFAVYVPDLSNPFAVERSESWSDWKAQKEEEFNYIESRYNLRKALKEDIVQPISQHYIEDSVIRLNPWNSAEQNKFYYNMAEALRYIKIKNWSNAVKAINKLIGYLCHYGCTEKSPIIKPYKKLADILENLNQRGTIDSNLFNDHLALTLMDLIKNPSNSLGTIKIPSCFDCLNCSITDCCHYFDIVALEKNIQNLQKVKHNERNVV